MHKKITQGAELRTAIKEAVTKLLGQSRQLWVLLVEM